MWLCQMRHEKIIEAVVSDCFEIPSADTLWIYTMLLFKDTSPQIESLEMSLVNHTQKC